MPLALSQVELVHQSLGSPEAGPELNLVPQATCPSHLVMLQEPHIPVVLWCWCPWACQAHLTVGTAPQLNCSRWVFPGMWLCNLYPENRTKPSPYVVPDLTCLSSIAWADYLQLTGVSLEDAELYSADMSAL